ncbi:hypothetical protein Avbf_00407 [Armadillidium vulgare]|nr:hypothetical protein Avbf_00407 [Armadillidium vulgare]
MPRLHCRHTSCCFCLSLQAGCKIIGVLTAFICGLELVSSCHQLIELLERERRCTENSDKWEELEEKSFLNICPHIKFVQFMLILDFIKFVIGFNGSILLLYGIKTRQPKLFIAWLIFCGLVIFTNFFSILMIRRLNVVQNVLVVGILCYLFHIVRCYRLQLYDELGFTSNGCPAVVTVAFPQESGVQVFVPSQQSETASDYIKDDPPPPYPGLPIVPSTQSIESQPPPYSVVISPNSEGPLDPAEASCSSLCQDVDSNHHMRNLSNLSRENSSNDDRLLQSSSSASEINDTRTNLDEFTAGNTSQSSNGVSRFKDDSSSSIAGFRRKK